MASDTINTISTVLNLLYFAVSVHFHLVLWIVELHLSTSCNLVIQESQVLSMYEG